MEALPSFGLESAVREALQEGVSTTREVGLYAPSSATTGAATSASSALSSNRNELPKSELLSNGAARDVEKVATSNGANGNGSGNGNSGVGNYASGSTTGATGQTRSSGACRAGLAQRRNGFWWPWPLCRT
jgi:hypothetical protein